ncbi:helix-turn-helix domain-containing protein [Streptomyces europaeiscabiei]|uniref:helix-turn-helix domain-containing protein n=1 Tax=Streptomyces europaeiscabiei TaxID=146819 RepID=UPI0006283C9C|nr:helix-turn-helix transcriptional regulator [Streptomyces europaeiscabiei]MDX2774171.1 helix-turn-helix transcriptional regulator [Streptomyces europaeiscabiei]MDX3618672.1 helix-turn-helix transcriptional regulator [Streptomyces europaeiscabiei]MDX3629598.1 helix-turn-helix transcriptional regulator [Streptomyces europaeiscabiei]MDX3648215.1 helix-turn-helix transcriptional regulator [Streptomyces europaeiscabiei]MDX3669091.1 helix-turn-helix transcriptional regulator [Streptomyces europaei
MPPRNSPSERQLRLGIELRKLRLRAGMSSDDAAKLLEGERSRISYIESGRLGVSRNRLHPLLRAYNCPPGPHFDELMKMGQASGKGWWDDFADTIGPAARDLAELEARSTVLRTHEPLAIPGMLQTDEYARAVLAVTEPQSPHVDRYAEFRLARQRVLNAEPPVIYHAVINEAALRTRVGGPAVMRRQLLRLMEVSRLPNVTVQVWPFESGIYSAHIQSFVIYGSTAPELDTVYLEHPTKSLFLRDGDQLDQYAKMFERLTKLALTPVDPESTPESHESRDSLSLIQHVMYDL